MGDYYVNTRAQLNGDHEVHKENCPWMPDPENKRKLGFFFNCKDAIIEAKKLYPRADGCKHCCPECHKR